MLEARAARPQRSSTTRPTAWSCATAGSRRGSSRSRCATRRATISPSGAPEHADLVDLRRRPACARIRPSTWATSPPPICSSASTRRRWWSTTRRRCATRPEKLFVTEFPDLMPPTLITRDRADDRSPSARSTATSSSSRSTAMAAPASSASPAATRISPRCSKSSRAPSASPSSSSAICRTVRQGDKRIILVDGVAGRRHQPRAGRRRGALQHACRRPARAGRDDAPATARSASAIGPTLKARGLIFVGIDVIGDYLTEINVTSPTGIREVKRFGGADIAALIWDAIEARRRPVLSETYDWLNPPPLFERNGAALVVTTAAKTDFWNNTFYGFRARQRPFLPSRRRRRLHRRRHLLRRLPRPLRPGRPDAPRRRPHLAEDRRRVHRRCPAFLGGGDARRPVGLVGHADRRGRRRNPSPSASPATAKRSASSFSTTRSGASSASLSCRCRTPSRSARCAARRSAKGWWSPSPASRSARRFPAPSTPNRRADSLSPTLFTDCSCQGPVIMHLTYRPVSIILIGQGESQMPELTHQSTKLSGSPAGLIVEVIYSDQPDLEAATQSLVIRLPLERLKFPRLAEARRRSPLACARPIKIGMSGASRRRHIWSATNDLASSENPMTIDITDPIYQDADLAREHLEALTWPNGRVCPHCGNVDQERITKLKGKSTRPGVYKCNECHKPFSVTVGTVFERSHIPLNKWLLAVHILSAGKKGTSAHQLWRMLRLRLLPHGLVHGSSHSRGDERRRSNSPWRHRQNCRS